MLAPLGPQSISSAPPVFAGTVIAGVLLTMLVVRLTYRRPVRRAPPWTCGAGPLTGRTQDTAEGFGQPIRHFFTPWFEMRRSLPTPFDAAPRYSVEIGDRIWRALYEPLAGWVDRGAAICAVFQRGRISTYLLYALATLCLLLALVL
jgi:hypothetical protein